MELSQYNNKFVVYLMTFPNGKKYCGYSSNIKRRWRNANEYKGQRVYKAIEKYGTIKGGLLSIKRILKCNPFSKGGYDPLK